MRRGWIGLVGVVMAAVVVSGCGLSGAGDTMSGGTPLLPATATPTPTPTPVPTPPPTPVPLPAYQAGVALDFYANSTWKAELPGLLTELHHDRVTCVSLTFPIYQAGDNATQVTAGTGTPSDPDLEAVIRSMEASGFSVTLRPLMDENDLAPDWRGNITPSSDAAWFQSYTTLMVHYGTIAARLGVQVFNVGSEFYSLEADAAGWKGVIQALRQVYPGQVTYSVNGISETGGGVRSGFWSALDFLSVDGYWDLGVANDATAAQLAAAWQPYLQQLQAAAGSMKMVLSEVGVVPQAGEQNNPWRGEQAGLPVDPSFQATYYDGACEAAGRAQLAGLYWWQINFGTPWQFDPLGAPAEQAMATCFGG